MLWDPEAVGVRRVFLLACFLLAGGAAQAGGALETPVLVVVVEDQRGNECGVHLAGFCTFEARVNNTPGDSSLDVFQQVHYAGVASNFSFAKLVLADAWILPDQSITLRGSDLYIRYPFLRMVTERYGEIEPVTPLFWIQLTPHGYGIRYYGPDLQEPLEPPHDRKFMLSYEEEGVGYEQTGPFNRPTGGTTDEWVEPTSELVCLWTPTEECRQTAAGVVDGFQAASPSLRFGLELMDVQVSTAPETLRYRSTGEDGGTAASGLPGGDDKDGTPHRNFTKAPQEWMGHDPRSFPRGIDSGEVAPKAFPPLRPQGAGTDLEPSPEVPLPFLVKALAVTFVLACLAASLYSRFNGKRDLLRSETRQRLLDLVQREPGISISDAAERLGLARNAIHHHLRMLHRVNLIKIHPQGQRKELYLAAATPSSEPAWLRRNPICRRIVALLSSAPEGIPRKTLHDLLPDIPERTRNYHLRRLVGAGVIVQEGGDRRVRLASAPGIR